MPGMPHVDDSFAAEPGDRAVYAVFHPILGIRSDAEIALAFARIVVVVFAVPERQCRTVVGPGIPCPGHQRHHPVSGRHAGIAVGQDVISLDPVGMRGQILSFIDSGEMEIRHYAHAVGHAKLSAYEFDYSRAYRIHQHVMHLETAHMAFGNRMDVFPAHQFDGFMNGARIVQKISDDQCHGHPVRSRTSGRRLPAVAYGYPVHAAGKARIVHPVHRHERHVRVKGGIYAGIYVGGRNQRR